MSRHDAGRRYELEDDTVSWAMASQDDTDLIPTDKLVGLRTDPLANVSEEFADPQRAKPSRPAGCVGLARKLIADASG